MGVKTSFMVSLSELGAVMIEFGFVGVCDFLGGGVVLTVFCYGRVGVLLVLRTIVSWV